MSFNNNKNCVVTIIVNGFGIKVFIIIIIGGPECGSLWPLDHNKGIILSTIKCTDTVLNKAGAHLLMPNIYL